MGIFIAWMQNRRPGPADYPQAPGALEVRDVATWTGSLEAPDGAQLRVRLTRLHPQAQRQEFETQALGQRFGKQTGEPWQLEIDAPPSWEAPIDLSELRIESAGAQPLQRLARRATPAGNQIVDPVRVLFSVPDGMQPGERRRFVVWGSEPAASATFVAGSLLLELQMAELPHVQGPLAERTASESLPASSAAAEPQVVK